MAQDRSPIPPTPSSEAYMAAGDRPLIPAASDPMKLFVKRVIISDKFDEQLLPRRLSFL